MSEKPKTPETAAKRSLKTHQPHRFFLKRKIQYFLKTVSVISFFFKFSFKKASLLKWFLIVIVPVCGAADEPIHPDFDFTPDRFAAGLTGLNDRIIEDPAGFLELSAHMLNMNPDYLLPADRQNRLDPDFVPSDLVALTEFSELTLSRNDLSLDRQAAAELVRLSNAAAAENIRLLISSSYRSYSYQENLFARYVRQDGREQAMRYSAEAGASQHQLGTTVDLGTITNEFASTRAGIWMSQNAGRFGWSLSYPQGKEEETGYMWESWHWRWIGPHAAEMQERFFGGSQQKLLEFWNQNKTVLSQAGL